MVVRNQASQLMAVRSQVRSMVVRGHAGSTRKEVKRKIPMRRMLMKRMLMRKMLVRRMQVVRKI